MNRLFQNVSNRVAAIALGGAVVLAGSALAFSQKPKTESFQAPPLDERPIAREAGSHASFAPVVKKVTPAVVKVFTTTKAHNTAFSGTPDGMDDMLRRFFGDQFDSRAPRRTFRAPRQEGVGSGVIVSKDGYILTNNHVVDGADEVKVALQDGREFTAKVIGRDPKTDVAVIRVDARDLPVVPMADSEKVEVGDVVLAIGNPFGIGQTVTTGIVSATGRSGATGLDYEDFIQTDAAINPGNSGGPLMNWRGEVIGINTMIYSGVGQSAGIGFAIPINTAKAVLGDLVTLGRVRRPALGIRTIPIDPELAAEMGLPADYGLLIVQVVQGGAADQAGLRGGTERAYLGNIPIMIGGDLIVAIDGQRIDDQQALAQIMNNHRAGDSVRMTIYRGKKKMDVTVSLGEAREQV